MKKVILIISLLACVFASSLEVNPNHVFAGEEFSATFSSAAPLSPHKLVFTLEGQQVDIMLPQQEVGTYTTQLLFRAPDAPGEYTITSSETEASVVVEKPLVVLEDVGVEPVALNPSESAKFSFTVKNTGEFKVYNVKTKVLIPIGGEMFDFDYSENDLFAVMETGAETTRVSDIRARENSGGRVRVGVEVSYEFDNEIHKRKEYADLTVGSFPLLEVIVLIVAILIGAKFLLPRITG